MSADGGTGLRDASSTTPRYRTRNTMTTQLKILTTALALASVVACAPAEPMDPSLAYSNPAAHQAKPVADATQQAEQAHIRTFDDLDFNVFSNQQWDRLGHSHARDVIVHWPDGRTTVGIDVHVADLKKLFVHAPDTRIKVHPHKIAEGNMTAVSGIMEGTFTRPMPLPGGSHLPATGKRFTLPMATIGRWENGVMQEEWLFWDNQSYLAQIGVAP